MKPRTLLISPVSIADICLTIFSLLPPGLPIWAPSVGTNTSAIASEAISVAISVIGRNFINSPTIPGQNSRGRKAASVVAVDAMIGQTSAWRPPRMLWCAAPFDHFPVGVFGNDDGAVDKQADR